MVTQQLSTEPAKQVVTIPLQMSYLPQQMSAYRCWMPSVSHPLSLAPAVSSAHKMHTHPASAVTAVFTVPHQVGTVSSTPMPVSSVPAQLSTVPSLVPVISMVNQSMHTLHPASQVPLIHSSKSWTMHCTWPTSTSCSNCKSIFCRTDLSSTCPASQPTATSS